MMFIYVTHKEYRDKLLSLGYTLLKEHKDQNIWVFAAKENMTFEAIEVPCITSNVLTF